MEEKVLAHISKSRWWKEVHVWQIPREYVSGRREDVLVFIGGGLRPQALEMASGPPLVPIGGRLLRVHPGDG